MTLLATLTPQEKREFELPPAFNKNDRARYFLITAPIKRSLSRMKNNNIRAGYLLQLAYFRASGQFYSVEDFRKRDIQYVKGQLKCNSINLNHYTSALGSKHRNMILKQLDWVSYTSTHKETLVNYALRQAKNQVKSKQIFVGMIDLCWKHQVAIPVYSELNGIITDAYNFAETGVLTDLDQFLDENERDKLENLLLPGERIRTRSRPEITKLKKISQSLRPKDIKDSIEILLLFKSYFMSHESVLQSIHLSDQATEYYATWFTKADYQQLNQFKDRNKVYLYLLSFIKHQYFKRQDALVDTLLKSVSSTLQSVRSKILEYDQATKKDRNEALQILNNSHQSVWTFIRSVRVIVDEKDATPSEKYYKIEALLKDLEDLSEDDEKKLDALDEYLTKESKNLAHYDLLEERSNKLQRRVSGIIKSLEFDPTSNSTELLDAIDHFKSTDGKIAQRAPVEFLDDGELDVVFQDEVLNVSLYKCLLFIHIAKALKSGDLNVHHSYRFRSIQDYLIDKQYWIDNRDRLLRETGLTAFADGDAYLEELKIILDELYDTVNERILDDKNPHFKMDAYNKPTVSTPGVESSDAEYIPSVLSKNGYVPILKVLKEVNAATNFTKSLQHFSNKNVKMKPSEETILAGLIGKGCNIGIRKIAKISRGLKEHKLHNTVTWFFDLKNIHEANRKIVDAIHSMDLANHYINEPNILHSSSDGRKVNVSVDSLLASRSFKYFGKDKGVTMYIFIDERQSLFYSTVFSSSDREAAYVIDGLLQNDVERNQIHSTDTHGFTEQIFAATHLIGVDFAPRLKNLKSQRIYGLSARRTFQKKGYKLLPSRIISLKLILQNWDDILRFMVTIKTNHTTASQLFKRLSSYAQTHQLYKALKEFGRIIKSKYILTYYDDLELRQQIQKQLNRVELSNKFAHAVFFDNDQAFQDGTKEEHELATACQVLLQNSIILWNYMYLSDQILKTRDKEQKAAIIEAIRQGSVITWSHVNLRGEYDFTRRAINDPDFEFKKLKSLKL